MTRQAIYMLLFSFILWSCDKEKTSLRRLNGTWEITSYSEIIYDGTTTVFDLEAGTARFEVENEGGKVHMTWNAYNLSDTSHFLFSGFFKQVAENQLSFQSENDTVFCTISRQLKKDMTMEFVLKPNQKSIVHLKKM